MIPSSLPTPSPSALAHSQAFLDVIQARYAPNTDIPFDTWMNCLLYQPSWGYYTEGLEKISGPSSSLNHLKGDFTTAPELSPWFGRTLAIQAKQILQASDSHHILEFGAGSGKLARSILEQWQPPLPHYFIVEVSPNLKKRQQQTLSDYLDHITWLDNLPTDFSGCILANEVLDAMPVKLVQWNEHHLDEVYVSWETGVLHYNHKPAHNEVQALMQNRMPWLNGYRTEINLHAEAWVRSIGQYLSKGGVILIDYGFPRREYYHPQRHQGTLMCHLQHHAHDNPLMYPGLQDITAHVDFTAMADAAYEAGLEILGYTSQARFLMNCGLLQHLNNLDPNDIAHYAKTIGPVQKLLSEAEMGELFKVMLLGKGIDIDPIGFTLGDRRHAL